MSRQQDAEHHIKYAEDRIDETCTQADRSSLLKCVHDEIKSAQDHGRAKSDLDAQMAMALWAKIMTLSGIAGSILAGGGLYLVWRTLETTGDAVDAANTANKIMRDEQRPWLILHRGIACDFVDIGHGGLVTWNRQFENRGRSPAFDITLRYTLIRRNHYQHMGAQLQAYLEDAITKNRQQNLAILLPGETTEFLKFEGQGFVRYQEDIFSVGQGVKGDEMLMACLTYRLGSDTEDVGYDVRMFGIEKSKRWIGPWGHELIEYSNARLIG